MNASRPVPPAENALYQELVLEHKRAPRTSATWTPTQPGARPNPQCGDDCGEAAAMDGRLPTSASAARAARSAWPPSMMTEAVNRPRVAPPQALQQRFRAVLTGELEPEAAELGKLISLAGVRRYPSRIKCALLGWHALMHAMAPIPQPMPTSTPIPTPLRHPGRLHEPRPRQRVAAPCGAVERVPDGTPLELAEGSWAEITQALGSSFTLLAGGQLVRLAGRDADAIGRPPPQAPDIPADVAVDDVRELVWQTLKTCYDPEIPVDIVELGLVYGCELSPVDAEQVRVDIQLTLTAPGCGMGEILADEVADKVLALPRVAEVMSTWCSIRPGIARACPRRPN
jgi:probable FeS assembly SUF system protein SufT